MAGGGGDDENYWPGYVDALTTMTMVLTFILMVLGVTVFTLSQNVSRSYLATMADAVQVDPSNRQGTTDELRDRVLQELAKAVKERDDLRRQLANPPVPQAGTLRPDYQPGPPTTATEASASPESPDLAPVLPDHAQGTEKPPEPGRVIAMAGPVRPSVEPRDVAQAQSLNPPSVSAPARGGSQVDAGQRSGLPLSEKLAPDPRHENLARTPADAVNNPPSPEREGEARVLRKPAPADTEAIPSAGGSVDAPGTMEALPASAAQAREAPESMAQVPALSRANPEGGSGEARIAASQPGATSVSRTGGTADEGHSDAIKASSAAPVAETLPENAARTPEQKAANPQPVPEAGPARVARQVPDPEPRQEPRAGGTQAEGSREGLPPSAAQADATRSEASPVTDAPGQAMATSDAKGEARVALEEKAGQALARVAGPDEALSSGAPRSAAPKLENDQKPKVLAALPTPKAEAPTDQPVSASRGGAAGGNEAGAASAPENGGGSKIAEPATPDRASEVQSQTQARLAVQTAGAKGAANPVLLKLTFNPRATQLDEQARKAVEAFARDSEAARSNRPLQIRAVADFGSSGITEERRTAFYRVLVVRQALIDKGIQAKLLVTRVDDSDGKAEPNTVEVRLAPSR